MSTYRHANRRWSVVFRGQLYDVSEVAGEVRIERRYGDQRNAGGATMWVGVRQENRFGEPGYRALKSHLPGGTERGILALVWAGDPARGEERKRTIFDENLHEAIARSERGASSAGIDLGALWLEQDRQGGPHSVMGARNEYEAEGGGVIYGWSGVHRYVVMPDGEVVFSRSHGRAAVPAAEAAGFRAE